MVNLEFKVSGTTEQQLAMALSLRLQSNDRVIYGYSIEGMIETRRVILYTNHSRDIVPFLVYHTPDKAAQLAFEWVMKQEYPKHPPDLSPEQYRFTKRWQAYCDDNGKVDGQPNSFIAIAPYWAIEKIEQQKKVDQSQMPWSDEQ